MNLNEIIINKTIDKDGFTEYISNIKDKLKYYKNSMYSVVIKKIEEYLSYKDIPNVIMNYKEILKYIVQLIDNLNSASVIGTLEYMDRVMKLNNTNILCEEKNNNKQKQSTTPKQNAITANSNTPNQSTTTTTPTQSTTTPKQSANDTTITANSTTKANGTTITANSTTANVTKTTTKGFGKFKK